MVKLVGDSGKGPGEKDQFRPKLIPMGKNPPADTGDTGKSLGQEDALQETMPTHCNILTWRIPWTEETDGLQSMGLQRVGHDCEINTFTLVKGVGK